MTTDSETSRPIVLIHGLWMTPLSWEGWAERFRARGHEVLTPAWPGLEGSVEELRRNPAPIAQQSVEAILEHYDRIIRGLPQPPIIMGHSFGGAFTEVLLDRGLGAAGVAVHPGPLRGNFVLPLSTIKSAFALLKNPIARHAAIPFTGAQFRYAFGNTLGAAESDAAHLRYAIPGSRNVLFSGANANLNPGTALRVNASRADRAPLLILGGDADHVVPASVTRANVKQYAKSSAVTEYREFPGRSHFTVGQPGWEAVADAAIEWAEAAVRK